MRKTGVALAVAPEPLTTVAGVALMGASTAMKSREPASLASLRDETIRAIGDLKSVRSSRLFHVL
jgi:hypothetical protein